MTRERKRKRLSTLDKVMREHGTLIKIVGAIAIISYMTVFVLVVLNNNSNECVMAYEAYISRRGLDSGVSFEKYKHITTKHAKCIEIGEHEGEHQGCKLSFFDKLK